jgi:flavodoxin
MEFQGNVSDKVVEIHISGHLTKMDYEAFVPRIEEVIAAQGKICILFEMHDFHGWDMAAAWEDLKFDIRHFRDIERLAVVGEAAWQKWMSRFCKPFTRAEIRYYTHDQLEEANDWLRVPVHSA